MLHRIEKTEHPLRVTRLNVKERSGTTREFDVVATVSLVRSLKAVAPEAPAAEAAPAPPQENPS
jgi:hypothetical protein